MDRAACHGSEHPPPPPDRPLAARGPGRKPWHILGENGWRILTENLQELAPGTRVRLAPGRLGTLREVNFTRAIVELDRGEARLREIAPGCEVEVRSPRRCSSRGRKRALRRRRCVTPTRGGP